MRRPLSLSCLCFVVVIIFVVEIFPYKYSFSNFNVDETVLIEGKVAKKEVKTKHGQTTYIITLEQIKSLSDSEKDNLRDKQSYFEQLNKAEGIMCYLSDSYVPNIGSTVCMEGVINTFDIPDNPGEFNMPLYYKIKGVDLRMYDCKLIAYSDEYSYIKEGLYRLKMHFANLLERCFRPQYAGIAKAILFAMNGEIEDDTKDLYQKNGMLHILCVSGLHVSILGMGLFKILKRLKMPSGLNAVICIVFMILYGVMIDMGTSVFRAVLMFSMNLISKLLKRTYDLLTAACVGAFLILFEQPLYMYHGGFLLSFLSVISLGTFRPIFPEKLCKIEFINNKVNSFFSTLSVWIFTLPIYGRFYYEVSLSGLLLNVLILPFVSVVLILVLGVCMLGTFFLPMGQWVATICEMFLWAFEVVFEFFEKAGNTTHIIGHISVWKCLLFYAGLTICICLNEKVKRKKIYPVIAGLCMLLVWRFPGQLTITCLSVGQGDCSIIEYKNMVCMIDAGSSTEKEVAGYTILPFLKYQGIREIDYLFLTHADSDHINAVEVLLEQSKEGVWVKCLVVLEESNENDYGNLWNVAERCEVEICTIKQGDAVSLNDLTIQCIAPDKDYLKKAGDSNNETSMVLLLKQEKFQMLFAADVEGEGEKLLIKNLKNQKISELTALKVAHHGSKNSTSDEFLQSVVSKISIISCGKNNRYGHPHQETIDRLVKAGSNVFVTKENGAITLKVRNGNIKVNLYRD